MRFPWLLGLATVLSVQDASSPVSEELEERVRAVDFHAGRDFWRSDREGGGTGPLLWIERPAGDPAAAAATVEATRAFYAPWLAALDRAFRESLAVPASLEPAPDSPVPAILMLSARRTYERSGGDAGEGGAFYSEELGALVAWSQAREPGPPEARREEVLRPYVRRLLATWTGGTRPRAPCWLVDRGVEDWLLGDDSREPTRAEDRGAPIGLLFELTSSLRMSRNARLVPRLEEMLRAPDADAMGDLIRTRTPDAPSGLDSLARRLDSGATRALPALWMHYLWSADDGANLGRLLKLFGLVQRGYDPLDSFRQVFDGRALPELERDFYGWVSDTYVERAYQAAPLEPVHLAFLDEPVPPPPADLKPGLPPPFDPSSLAPLEGPAGRPLAVEEVALAHALALDRARRGDLGGARALVARALTAAELAGELALAGRLERERDRLAALEELRDDYLAHLLDTGGRLRLEDEDGKRRALRIEAIEDGRVRFASNRHGFDELALDALPSMELAVELDDFVDGSEREWLRFYPYVLAGDARWKRLLRPRDEAGEQLERDAGEWLAEAAARGRAVGALETLAAGGRPQGRAEAQRTLEAITTLVAEHGELPAISERRADLRRLAGVCCEQLYDPLAWTDGFHGTVEHQQDGTVRLRYDFDDEDEALDLERVPGYLADWREGLVIGSDEDSSFFEVRGGVFGGSGAVCYRHPLRLSQPVSARCGLEIGSVSLGSLYVRVLVAICDAGDGNQVAAVDMGDLLVRDTPGQHYQVADTGEERAFELDHVYDLEVRVADGVATLWIDGARVHELPAGPRTSGSTILFSHSDAPVRFHWLELEGRVDPAETERLRGLWVEDELERLGLQGP